MTILHALSILAISLGQTAAPRPGEDTPPASARLAPAQGPEAAPKPPPPVKVKEGALTLQLDRTTRCFERGMGGRWRAQCDAAAKRCLVAPDMELDAEGLPASDLDRAPRCALPGWREDELAAQGYQMVPALAETPPGWHRDERQRIMQVSFDLNRRIWLGAGYGAGGFPRPDGGEATAGVRFDVPFHLLSAPALARVRAFETFAAFDGTSTDFTAFGVDASRAYPSPLLRITTFVGKPRRFDPPLFVGGWLEVARVETLRTPAGWFDRTEAGAAALTLDLWRSRDLASFARLRGGAGYESTTQLDGAAWVSLAALDVDLGLDRGGFHHLRLTSLSEWLVTTGVNRYQPKDPATPRLPAGRSRQSLKAEYEVVLLAVNDQPVSAVLDVRGQRRNDVPGLDGAWHFQGTASLRFNLWAPPRRDAPVQEKL